MEEGEIRKKKKKQKGGMRGKREREREGFEKGDAVLTELKLIWLSGITHTPACDASVVSFALSAMFQSSSGVRWCGLV